MTKIPSSPEETALLLPTPEFITAVNMTITAELCSRLSFFAPSTTSTEAINNTYAPGPGFSGY